MIDIESVVQNQQKWLSIRNPKPTHFPIKSSSTRCVSTLIFLFFDKVSAWTKPLLLAAQTIMQERVLEAIGDQPRMKNFGSLFNDMVLRTGTLSPRSFKGDQVFYTYIIFDCMFIDHHDFIISWLIMYSIILLQIYLYDPTDLFFGYNYISNNFVILRKQAIN